MDRLSRDRATALLRLMRDRGRRHLQVIHHQRGSVVMVDGQVVSRRGQADLMAGRCPNDECRGGKLRVGGDPCPSCSGDGTLLGHVLVTMAKERLAGELERRAVAA